MSLLSFTFHCFWLGKSKLYKTTRNMVVFSHPSEKICASQIPSFQPQKYEVNPKQKSWPLKPMVYPGNSASKRDRFLGPGEWKRDPFTQRVVQVTSKYRGQKKSHDGWITLVSWYHCSPVSRFCWVDGLFLKTCPARNKKKHILEGHDVTLPDPNIFKEQHFDDRMNPKIPTKTKQRFQ